MINSRLFEQILIKPVAEQGADELFVVSGYATAAMAFHHFQRLFKDDYSINLHLIVGMTVQDGLSLSNHRGFQDLMNNDLSGIFECSYIMEPPPVHSKVYTWFRDGKPIEGFVGSANYSQKAFHTNQRESMGTCNPEYGYEYYQSLIRDTIYCTHPDAEYFVQIFDDKYLARRKREALKSIDNVENEQLIGISGLEHVRVSFINKFGEVSQRSGLNWGQRPEYHREPNQAYIPLTADIYKTDFFPPISRHFTVYTDDGKVLICSRAQQEGKAIHTPHNNSLIGEYFRMRLGVPHGYRVTMEHLQAYGRSHVDFYKIDEETYYMDFHV